VFELADQSRYGLRCAAVAAAAVAAALGLAGCSSSAIDTPYPAVHDMPAARPQPPMTPEELQRATDVLLSDRAKLNGEAQAATATGSTAAPPQAAAAVPPPAPPAPPKGQKTGTSARP